MKNNSSILITGSSGLAGTYLISALIQAGYSNLYLLDVIEDKQIGVFFKGSVCDSNLVDSVVDQVRPDYIFHLAGLVGHHKLKELIDVNLKGTENIFEALLKCKLYKTRVLITSSSAVYGDKGKISITEDIQPSATSPYSESKVLQEELSLSYFIKEKIPVIITRAFNNFAPGEKEHMFISRLASQIVRIEKGKQEGLSIGPLFSYRDYLDTRDVVQAYILIMQKGKPGEIYNVCSGEAIKIQDIFQFLIRKALIPIQYEIVEYNQKGNIPFQVGSPLKLKKLTSWEKTKDIWQTLEQMIDYWRDNI